MPTTIASITWALIGLVSLLGLYLFNTKQNLMAFITKREYLVVFLIASLMGMRELNGLACVLCVTTMFFMVTQYPNYLKRCWVSKYQRRMGDRDQQGLRHRKS